MDYKNLLLSNMGFTCALPRHDAPVGFSWPFFDWSKWGSICFWPDQHGPASLEAVLCRQRCNTLAFLICFWRTHEPQGTQLSTKRSRAFGSHGLQCVCGGIGSATGTGTRN